VNVDQVNKQTAQKILEKIANICNIQKQNLILVKQKNTTDYEIHTEQSLQEKQWLCLEEIIQTQNLRLKIADNLIIIF